MINESSEQLFTAVLPFPDVIHRADTYSVCWAGPYVLLDRTASHAGSNAGDAADITMKLMPALSEDPYVLRME